MPDNQTHTPLENDHSPEAVTQTHRIIHRSDYRAGRARGLREGLAICVAVVALLAIGFVVGVAVGDSSNHSRRIYVEPTPYFQGHLPQSHGGAFTPGVQQSQGSPYGRARGAGLSPNSIRKLKNIYRSSETNNAPSLGH